MATGNEDDVERMIAALSGDHTTASAIEKRLRDTWDDRHRDALLNALRHDPNPIVRQRAATILAYPASDVSDERVIEGL